jgi:hypothetical protein
MRPLLNGGFLIAVAPPYCAFHQPTNINDSTRAVCSRQFSFRNYAASTHLANDWFFDRRGDALSLPL